MFELMREISKINFRTYYITFIAQEKFVTLMRATIYVAAISSHHAENRQIVRILGTEKSLRK